jgi:hypothetical protein
MILHLLSLPLTHIQPVKDHEPICESPDTRRGNGSKAMENSAARAQKLPCLISQ